MAEGWIKIHRQFLEHWLCDEYRPLTKREAWENMLFFTNYTDKKVLIKGQTIECKRGQIIYSLETWSLKFNWTIGQVRQFFKLLENDNMIKVEGLKYTTRLTICNYDKYQIEQQSGNILPTFCQHSPDILPTTTKEGKEGKQGKKERSKPKKSADFIDNVINEFIKEHGNYEIINAGKERTAAAKLLSIYKKKFPDANSEETINSLRVYFNACINISDPWLHDNMSLPLIISKFNEINNYLKNGKHKKDNGASLEEIAGHFASKYGTDSAEGQH